MTAAIDAFSLRRLQQQADYARVCRIADQLLAQGHVDNRPDAMRFALSLLVAAERCEPDAQRQVS